jgi:hypothetical protein
MIIVRIDGPLEQQVNQYLFGCACACALQTELKLDLSAAPARMQDKFGPHDCAASDAEIAAAKQCLHVTETTLLFDPALPEQVRDGAYLDGVWADYRYAGPECAGLADRIMLPARLDAASLDLLAAIESSAAACIDLRQDLLPPAYFEDAVKELRARIPAVELFVFTSRPAEVGTVYRFDAPCTVVPAGMGVAEEQCLALMRACRHHVVTYRSLPYIAALLCSKSGGCVIAPQQSFDPRDSALLARFGQIEQAPWPASWLVLPIRIEAAAEPLAAIAGGQGGAQRMRVGVWNYYEEITTQGFLFKHAEASIGAGLLKPWVDLYQYGQAHGIDFVTLDQVSGVAELDAVLFMDRPRPGNPMIEQLMQADIAKYLLIYETEVIKPDNWDLDFHRHFDRIFTWSDAHADGRRYVKINFAIDPASPYDFATLKSAFGQRKLASMIAGAKASNHPFELYSARLRTIRWFEACAEQDFDLYGGGWDGASFPSYRGRVNDKLATLARYRFSICYENAMSIPGYITEKILDCFRAGTVPVYGGAPNITRWVPQDCFIDIGQFQTYAELHQHLTNMDAATHAGYLDRIAAFLRNGKAYPFSSACFVATVSQFIAFDIGMRRGWTPQSAPAPRTPGSTLAMVQDLETMAIRVLEQDAPAPTVRETMAAASHPDLIVYLGYGEELPVFKRARALWEFYLSHFPNIKAFFVRDTDKLARGEVMHNGYDLLVGIGNDDPAQTSAAGYRQTGVWSASENAGVIFKQMAVFDYLLRKHDKPFYLYHATVTSVVDFRGLLAVMDQMPKTGCFAGMPGRLNSPPELAGLSFICGTNSLFSRDVVELLRNRYDPQHPHANLPNDIWQSLVLKDIPRRPIPFFSFVKPRATGARLDDVAALTRCLLADGHFHFRIKTTSEESGTGKREDVDPWIMLKIMETILEAPGAAHKNRELMAALNAFTGGAPEGFGAFADEGFFNGPRNFALTELEAPILYPAPA